MSILFFDIDNTLFSHKTFTIPDSTRKALELAKANGHILMLASGRGKTGLMEFFDRNLFDGAICASGAYIIWQDEIILEQAIPQPYVRPLIQLAQAHDTGLSVQGKNENWLSESVLDRIRHNENMEAFRRRRNILTLQEYNDEPVYKFDFFFPNLEQANALIRELPQELTICPLLGDVGRGSGCEVSPAGVTKGAAIRSLLAWLNIDRRESYGFGDSENDLEMMEECGTGIAMGNATDGIKAAADYVTDDIEEDGIWNAMKHFHFI